MRELALNLSNGTVMIVPATLASITTYVLLEQEAWFEKELDFVCRWVRPGMTVIDIGANLGVYSLPLARRVAPGGRVFAYEPGSEPRGLLGKSAGRNGCRTLELVGSALSDGARTGRLATGRSSELASLGGGGAGEAVPVTSLDLEDARHGWAAPDFLKIDAEGEEERILAGGRAFFARHSPLVMFEVRAGTVVNDRLRQAFRDLGYGIYRLLAGAPILVPDRADEPPDAFELNLFAAKPERAAALAREGFLVEPEAGWQPDEAARGHALALLRAQPFARVLAPVLDEKKPLDPAYRDALAAYARWRSPGAPAEERCAALVEACRLLEAACRRSATFPRLMTFARASFDAGRRGLSVQVLRQLVDQATRGPITVTEPFWPASPHHEAIDPGKEVGTWFMAAAVEQLERTASFSSQFAPPGPHLAWLCATPFASAEMARRQVLQALKAGGRPAIPPRLRAPGRDHLNAKLWRGGLDGLDG